MYNYNLSKETHLHKTTKYPKSGIPLIKLIAPVKNNRRSLVYHTENLAFT